MSQRFTDACGNSLSYTLDSTNNTAMLDSGNQRYYANPVVIPSTVTYNGTTYTVTTIGGNAFFNASFNQGITIPSTVTAIYSQAFYQCYCPSSVIVIPNSVTNMSDYGIFNRSNILGCVLPSNLLDSDRTAASYKNYKGMGGGMFGQSQTISQFTFPNTLTKIPDLTFYSCGSIKTVVIPSSITYIGDRAFSQCGSLTSFVMPNSVTSIHGSAFQNCGNLTSFVMSASLASCPILQNCSSLPSIVLPASVTYIPDNAFAGCTALSLVTILGPLTTIGQSAFSYCTSLTSISLPATVSTINYTAFSNCTNLTSFTVPAATSSIATGNAFFNCPKLTSFSVDPSNVYYSSDSSGVLFNKAKTTLIKCPEGNVNASYKVPSTVTTITDNAFYSCKNLISITVDSSSVTFGYLPFDNANNFKNVYFTYPTPPKITVSTLLTSAQQSVVVGRYPKTTTQDASYNAVLRAAGFTSVLSYPLPNAVISAVFSDNSNNYIDISGTNFMDAAIITINGTTQPTSFKIVNNNLIVAYFETNTQVSSVLVSDIFGNSSDTYQLTTPILTTKPSISSVQIDSSANLTINISGTYLNQTTDLAVNDVSANIVSKSDTLIIASLNALSLVNTITLYAGSTAVLRQTVNLSTYPKSPPVITAATTDSSNSLFITGTSFLNLKLVEIVNAGSVYQSFNSSQFDICGNTLLRVNLSSRLKMTASIRVTDNYNAVSNLFSAFPRVISNTCFPADTPIRTDQGLIAIDKINPEKHTIRKKTILAVTQTIHPDNYLIFFEKNALGNNIPCEKTIISKDHGIFYNGKMRKAKAFVNEFPNVNEVPYNGEVLYNVLMEEHDKMIVNNLICETLNPENGIAKYYRILPSLTLEEQQEFVKKVNSRDIKTSSGSSKRINK